MLAKVDCEVTWDEEKVDRCRLYAEVRNLNKKYKLKIEYLISVSSYALPSFLT